MRFYDEYYDKALSSAIRYGHLDCVEALSGYCQDDYLPFALCKASKFGQIEIVKYFFNSENEKPSNDDIREGHYDFDYGFISK